MHRFFVPPTLLAGERIELSGDLLHQLSRVLRLQPGDELVLLDGRGESCLCRIAELGRRAGELRVLRRWREAAPAWSLRLLQGLPKGDKIDLVLQKGTELGVTTFSPVLSGRSIPRLDGPGASRRMQRWERIVVEASRQCRRDHLPHLDRPLPLADALAGSEERLRLMLWEEESRPLHQVLPAVPPESAAVLIGPEGGFSPAEAELALAAGFVPVRLGPRILRTETAGLTVISILQYLYGDLGEHRAPSAEALP